MTVSWPFYSFSKWTRENECVSISHIKTSHVYLFLPRQIIQLNSKTAPRFHYYIHRRESFYAICRSQEKTANMFGVAVLPLHRSRFQLSADPKAWSMRLLNGLIETNKICRITLEGFAANFNERASMASKIECRKVDSIHILAMHKSFLRWCDNA